MAFEYRTTRRVEFAETDMAGIMHFSNFFKYMEMTEHEFLRSLGVSVHAPVDGTWISWPRVHAECTYRAPVRFEDELRIHLVVREKRSKAIVYDFRFFDRHDKLIARGSLTVVCASVAPVTGQISSLPIPAWIDEKIEAAPAELLQP